MLKWSSVRIRSTEKMMTPDERREKWRRENLAAARSLVVFLLFALAGMIGISFAVIKILGG